MLTFLVYEEVSLLTVRSGFIKLSAAAQASTPPGRARAGVTGRARAVGKGRAGSIPSTSAGSMEDNLRVSVGVSLGDEDNVDRGQGAQRAMANRAAAVSQSDDLQVCSPASVHDIL